EGRVAWRHAARAPSMTMMSDAPIGVVILAHRDDRLAALLGKRGLATVQLDLESDASVEQVASRLVAAIDAVVSDPAHRGLPIGLFVAGRCAAAAVIAGAQRIDLISAVVGAGCDRPELAGVWLQALRTPTLLIVGSQDTAVVRANRAAARAMVARHRVAVIPGANHLFEEPGALDEVAAAAGTWFVTHARAAWAVQKTVA
ncbi:MAG TPA: dienelactone hydrolase family protein, partial [Kofleriaceae bacterium]